MLIPFGVFGAGGAGSFELIRTISTSGASSYSFTDIPQTYKHLQIRYTARGSGSSNALTLKYNGDTAANYRNHYLQGNGSNATSGDFSAYTAAAYCGFAAYSTTTATIFGAGIVDIHDYTNASKFKTGRSMTELVSPEATLISVMSHLWRANAAITNIEVMPSTTFATGSRVSLYGIKG